MITNLFVYGTLMSEDIMFRVSGCRFVDVGALLRDYQRREVRGEVYPGIVPSKGHVVEGVMYGGISEAVWQRLDAFEGEMYQRTTVMVEREDGTITPAYAYVIRSEFADRLGPEEGSPGEFLQGGLQEL